ncbi:MAG TPA: hypothetical protein PLZ57_05575 [Pseudobdellovibrionaceae bacterium]|nr:hypothetical protein [Pseudobdellovibrionaceae bacterium]
MSLAKYSQSLCAALLCWLAYSPMASAHIGLADDYECSDSYKKDCWAMGNSRKILRLWFKGSEREMGTNCQAQTQKLTQQIHVALQDLGLSADRIGINGPHVEFTGQSGRATEYRCSYAIWSKQEDLRFQVRHHNRRFWIDDEDLKGVCREDLREAESKPRSIGGGISLSAALLQGVMCYTTYAVPGLDRIKTFPSGATQLIKFGSSDDERDRQGQLPDPKESRAPDYQN